MWILQRLTIPGVNFRNPSSFPNLQLRHVAWNLSRTCTPPNSWIQNLLLYCCIAIFIEMMHHARISKVIPVKWHVQGTTKKLPEVLPNVLLAHPAQFCSAMDSSEDLISCREIHRQGSCQVSEFPKFIICFPQTGWGNFPTGALCIFVRASAGSFLRTQSATISEVPVSITLAPVSPFATGLAIWVWQT